MSRKSEISEMNALRAELLLDIAQRVADYVREYGLPHDLADQVGAGVADFLADDWGGQVVSIPKDHAYRLSLRDQNLLDAHRNGESIASIATRTKMTTRGVRRLLRRAELRNPTIRQPELPLGT